MRYTLLIFSFWFSLPVYGVCQSNSELTEIKIEYITRLTRETLSATRSSSGLTFDAYADQIASTQWGDGLIKFLEPREPAEGLQSINDFTQSYLTSFEMIQVIESGDFMITDGDNPIPSKESVLISLYFLKGLSLCYLSLIYDSALYPNPNTSLSTHKNPTNWSGDYWGAPFEYTGVDFNLLNYNEIQEIGLSDLEIAIDILDSIDDSDFEWFITNSPIEINKLNFKKLVHSFIAKVLINTPRTSKEVVNYDEILRYARNGLDNAYPNIVFTKPNSFPINNRGFDDPIFLDPYFVEAGSMSNCGSGINITCNAIRPVDPKVIHLLNKDYPKTYPPHYVSDDSLSLPAITSDDIRHNYFRYAPQQKPIHAIPRYSNYDNDEDSYLNSNYFSLRTQYNGNIKNDKYQFIFMTRAELQYIIAEAEFKLGNIDRANEALQNSPYGTKATDFVIDLPVVQLGFFSTNGLTYHGSEFGSDLEIFKNLLHKEYSIEIGTLGTIGTVWFFMRRHDLLQAYTPLHLPVPKWILNQRGETVYNFGGSENIGVGTSSGLGAWKKSQSRSYNPYLRVDFVGNEEIGLYWNRPGFERRFPGEPIPKYRLTGSNGLDTLLSVEVERFEVTGLENKKPYMFSLETLSEIRQDYEAPDTLGSLVELNDYLLALDNDRVLYPNKLGIQSFVDSWGYFPETTHQSSYTGNLFYNSFDIDLVIDSVQIKLFNKGDSLAYNNNIKTFFKGQDSPLSILPKGKKGYGVTFTSELWGEIPDLKFIYNTNMGVDTTYLFGKFLPAQGVHFLSPWEAYYSAEDKIDFGLVEVGVTDSVKYFLRNMSFRTMFIDELSIREYNSENQLVESETFYYKKPDSTIILEPYDWLELWVYVDNISSEPKTAFGHWSGVISNGPKEIGKFTINQGERTVVGSEIESGFPKTIELSQNYPNPFNPSTTINYAVPEQSSVRLEVFNMLGQQVATLVDGEIKHAGRYSVQFNASTLSSGMYFYRLETSGAAIIQKMTLIK